VVSIKPFAALHPQSSKAKAIACFPYDVAGESEARSFIAENPYSFLRVTRPEAEFAEPIDPSSDDALQSAKRNLQELIESGSLVEDGEPGIYVYRLATETHSQTGIVACCSLAEYESGVVKKHERTRPDKVADRTAHMVALRAQTGLILIAFKDTETIADAIAEAVKSTPLFEFVCGGNITHTVWKVASAERFVDAFTEVPTLYIADGHHRIEAALNARDILRSKNGTETGNAKYDHVLAGIFPAGELRILPYNRVVKDINGLTDEEFFAGINATFVVSDAEDGEPTDPGFIKMYFREKWYQLKFNIDFFRAPDPIERLDVTILQKYILEPVLGISDPRTDERITFVGGARGTQELERMVDEGEAAAAFSLHATAMDDLFEVSDMDEIMPPKSTWFEPKLKDGLFVYQI
jgi:uncharacterized protein (DUF1015 family)